MREEREEREERERKRGREGERERGERENANLFKCQDKQIQTFSHMAKKFSFGLA